MMLLLDNFTILSYKIDITNIIPANRTTFIQTYAKPYYIVNKPIGSTYSKMPDVNYPYLHTIEYIDGIYDEYILGQERSIIKFTLDTTTGDDFPYEIQGNLPHQYIYKVSLTYELETDTPYSKDVRSLINDYTTIRNAADHTRTLKYVHNYSNANKLTASATQILTNNNDFDCSSDFVFKQQTISLYNVVEPTPTKPDRAYSTYDVTPLLSLNKNYINGILILTTNKTDNYINVVYTVDNEHYNTYSGTIRGSPIDSASDTTNAIYNRAADEYIPIINNNN